MVLVSIVGDFDSSILPVFYELKDQITTHIVIYDDYKKDVQKANKLIKGIEAFKQKHQLKFKSAHYKIDEDSKNSIDKIIEICKIHTENLSDLVINVTDGHATINSLLSTKLLPLGVKLIAYDRYDNHANLISDDNLSTVRFSKSIPIQDHFLLRNMEIIKIGDKQFAHKYKNEIISIFQKYLAEFKIFKSYAMENSTIKNTNRFPNIAKIIKNMGLENLNLHQTAITGGLFEYYVYLLVDELEVEDIEIGIVLHDHFEGGYMVNEFDILFTINNHVHMIECKDTSNYKLDSLVYKYISLQDTIDEDAKMAMVLSNREYHKKIDYKNFTQDMPFKRAYINDIMIRGTIFKHEDVFIDDLSKFFNLCKKVK